ncbi:MULTISPECIES: chromate efflux transporter [unclassified Acidovorax]|uniref:chromate efflux transporter n=1 Tax=unclassified Acidovorax TaxID=2684926 RepID=UPI000B3FD75A|nr:MULTISPECIES: chromate efflux transporter [unclassified Acidovorax]
METPPRAPAPHPALHPAPTDSAWQVFLTFLQLGLTAFGGPVAHLGHFRQALVVQRRWMDDRQYADLVALCQFLPGPASSQVGMALGLWRAGRLGALAAWAGFTLPSALLLIGLAWGLGQWAHALHPTLLQGALHGLKLAAAAVVTQALWGMARTLCPDTPRRLCMAVIAVLAWAWPQPGMQVGLMAAAGVAWALWAPTPAAPHTGTASPPMRWPLSRREGALWLGALAALLLGLPAAMALWPGMALAVADAFVRTGALVFGGGHVVLPLLQAEVVPNGWVSDSVFMAGYGAAQAVPGPLFTFAAYLGAALAPVASNLDPAPAWLSTLAALGWGLLALVAVFTPAWMLLAGSLPFWEQWKSTLLARKAIFGINSAVVGLLAAAWVDPVLSSALHSVGDGVLVIALLGLLQGGPTRGRAGTSVEPSAGPVWRAWPAWAVVGLACVLGSVLGALPGML